jgi:predicted nucleic acid-binding Zn ribbon protein
LHRTTAIYTGLDTGRLDWVHGPSRAYRMSARGGAHETVEAFAFEAWQAYLARRLYELASREVLDEAAIVRLMDDTPQRYSLRPGVPNDFLPGRSPRARAVARARTRPERDGYTDPIYDNEPRTDEEAKQREILRRQDIRFWALGIVEQAVMLKVENDCYPTVEGSPGSYEQGWGFKSLLGALWLQMMWLMLGEHNHCRWCGSLFEPTRRDKRFCDADCRQAWNYHKGRGKSSRRAKKIARDSRKS